VRLKWFFNFSILKRGSHRGDLLAHEKRIISRLYRVPLRTGNKTHIISDMYFMFGQNNQDDCVFKIGAFYILTEFKKGYLICCGHRRAVSAYIIYIINRCDRFILRFIMTLYENITYTKKLTGN